MDHKLSDAELEAVGRAAHLYQDAFSELAPIILKLDEASDLLRAEALSPAVESLRAMACVFQLSAEVGEALRECKRVLDNHEDATRPERN